MEHAPGKLPSRRVRAALQAMHDLPEHPWTVGELATIAHSSPRAMQRAFQEEFGHGVIAHLRLVRLERVRHDLRLAHPGAATVSQIADSWGFTHLGRFATYYREVFGESPSETLRHY
jgi:transcriptional regulator GlxA family with amidase domain